ncbi:MAG: diguanylate cyclase [Acidimicrobiales bacterium]|nr:diguanylate cyclase [Acidimicrobiales bacterium]
MTDSHHTDTSRRLGLRSLLVLVALLPLLGLVTLAAVAASDHWSARETAQELADETERLDLLVAARTAVVEEQQNSGAIALSDVFGLEVEEFAEVAGFDVVGALADSRDAVDDITLPSRQAAFDRERNDLERVRNRVDQGEATFQDVTAAFEPVNGLLDGMISDQLDRIVVTATSSRLPGEIMKRLDALESSLEAFAQVGEIGTHGTQILVGTTFLPELVTPEAVTDLVESTSRFDTAVQAARSFEDVPAADAWEEFLNDPGAQNTQDGYDQAVALGLGTLEEADVSPDTLATAFADATRWAELINQALETASQDLRAAAQSHVREETTSMAWQLGGTALLTAVALVVATRIAHSVARPMERIADAAGRVQQGELELEPVESGGPREVAATADAFNDMAATLTEVERRTIALAEEPDDPSLNTPLPGRVGQALQGALDRLRVSIRLAEDRRAELQRVATHDGLTGLLNRTAALDSLARELAQSRRDGARTFALFIDLDGLKPINDNHGHDAGDDAIRLTADALRSQTRDADVVARLGGDEFLVAGRVDQGSAAVENLAERIVAAVGAQAVRVLDGEIPLRCSAGIATTGPGADDESVDELVQRADTALYQAKRDGGSRTSWGPTVTNGPDRE